MPGNFLVNTEITLSTTNETNVLYVVNPSANTSKLFGIILTGTSLYNSTGVTFRIYVDPVVTANGTSLSIISKNFVDGGTSSMNVYSGPTATSKGTKISTFSVITSESYTLNTTNWYLSHGHSFLVTAQLNTSNKGLGINMSWNE